MSLIKSVVAKKKGQRIFKILCPFPVLQIVYSKELKAALKSDAFFLRFFAFFVFFCVLCFELTVF